MKNSTMAIGCILLFLLLTVGDMNAVQTLANSQVDSSQKEELDNAFLRIIYTFDQEVKRNKEKIIVTDTMALDIAQNWSVYYDWNKMRRDSIAREEGQKLVSSLKAVNVLRNPDSNMIESFERRNLKPQIMNDRNGENARIYKNRIINEIITIDYGPGSGSNKTYLRLREQIPVMDWQILEDTLSIMGYLCNKATATFRGRIYTAWFSLEIPVNEGPWKLYGLPGVILRAETEDGLFCFQSIGLEQLKEVPIRFPSNRHFEEVRNLKQLNDYRKNELREIDLSYVDQGTMTILKVRNPSVYNDLELIE